MFLKMQKNFLSDVRIVYGFKNGILPLYKKDDMKIDSGDILNAPEQTEFNDFFNQIKEEQNNIDMRLLSKSFPYKRPDRMV